MPVFHVGIQRTNLLIIIKNIRDNIKNYLPNDRMLFHSAALYIKNSITQKKIVNFTIGYALWYTDPVQIDGIVSISCGRLCFLVLIVKILISFGWMCHTAFPQNLFLPGGRFIRSYDDLFLKKNNFAEYIIYIFA